MKHLSIRTNEELRGLLAVFRRREPQTNVSEFARIVITKAIKARIQKATR